MTGDGTLTKWQYKQKEGTNNFDANWTDISKTATSLSHTFTGLTNSTNYQYKVRAVNATGESAESSASDSVAPLAVTLTASGITFNSATLTIANWASDWYYKRTAPSTPTPSCSSVVSSPTKTADLSSLSGNTDYTWKAYSDSACTTANVLASEDFLTLPSKPGRPSVTTNVGSGKLTLTASVTGGGTLTKWQYKQKEGTNNFDANWSDISETSTSLSHTFTGLTNGTNYQYKVRAVNATGNSAESDASTAIAPKEITLTASSVTADSATLTIANWTADWYHKRTSPSTPSPSCSSVVSSPTKTANLSNLSGNTDYTWKAYSDSGCTTAKELVSEDFLTKPDKPAKPTVTYGPADGELTLAASVTGNGTITKWQYQQKTGSNNFGSWQDFSSSGSTSLSHTFSDLTSGTNYQFKVRAVNTTGNSATSDASDAKSPPFLSVTVSNVGANTGTLAISWPGSTVPTFLSYKSFSRPYNSCRSISARSTISWSILNSNTNYRFTLYKDNVCSAKLITAPRFKTLPGTPTTPTVTKKGSGELVIASSVLGNPALDKWQYIKKEGTEAWENNWTDIDVTATSLSHTVTGLTDGTLYGSRCER